MLQRLFRKLRQRQRFSNHNQRRRRGCELRLENLEDRLVPAPTTIYVNDVADGVFNPPQVLPTTLGPVVSLRDAINAANNDTLGTGLTDTIVLLPGTYTLNNVDNLTLGANALPVITGNIIIEGAGSLPVTLNVAGASMRIFDIAPTGHLTLQSLTLSGGLAQGASGSSGSGGGGGAAGLGGAIFNQGDVNIYGCTLVGNEAMGGAGGASTAGAGGNGGGFAGGAGGSFGASGSDGGFAGGGGGGDAGAFGGNGGFGSGGGGGTAGGGVGGFAGGNGDLGGGGGAGLGGAIFNDAGVVTMLNSTLTRNSAVAGPAGTGGSASAGSAFGGAIFNFNGGLDTFSDTIAGNTLVGNAAPATGSDVYNLGDGVVESRQATVSQGTINETLTFPNPGPQADVIINAANLTGAPVTSVVTTVPGALPITDAVQSLTFGGSITGGWFTLTLGGPGGPTTAPIPWTDSPAGLGASIQSAISNLVGAYSVKASEGTVADGYAGAVSATLTFANPSSTESTTTVIMYNQAVDAQNNGDNMLYGTYQLKPSIFAQGVQTLAFNGNITGGVFALGFVFVPNTPAVPTNAIPWSNNPAQLASDIQNAVNALFSSSGIPDSVVVGAASVYDLAFPDPGVQQPVTIDTTNLTGAPIAVSIDNGDGDLPDVTAIQTLAFTGTITGGTFTLTFTGVNGAAGSITTAPIPWDINPSNVAANIRFAINNIIAELNPKVSVGLDTDTVAFAFPGDLLTADASKLTGGGFEQSNPSVSVTTNNGVATINFGGDITGGSFTLFNGAETVPVAWSNDPAALAAKIQSALDQLIATQSGTDMSDSIVGQYADNAVNGGSNYSTGSNNLAQSANVAAGQTLSFAINSYLGLDSLGNNGGLTQTMALLDNSPAINAGANLTALFKTDYNQTPTDQRGVNRGVVWSIGAYQDSAPGQAANITLVAGGGKSGTVGKAYARTVQVLVTDAFGNPVSGAVVTFSAPTSGPTVSFSSQFVSVGATGKVIVAVHKSATPGQSVTGTTNASGVATASLTANTKAGSFTATITTNGASTPVLDRLTNFAGAPASIVIVAGNSQSATVATNYATALQVKVTDTYGNPVSGATVTFQAPASGATANFSGSSSATAVTSALGIATAPVLTAGNIAGPFTLNASTNGKTVGFHLQNLAAGAARISLVTASAPTGNAGNLVAVTETAKVRTFFAALTATVTDAFGNPLKDALVTFTVEPNPSTGAGATFNGKLAVAARTNSSGKVTIPALRANGFAGTFTVVMSVAGVSVQVNLANVLH